ncbi:MAG: hypothetical protein N2515_06055 [Deltaproteobacteria bacterium]|nr:hypothetical protein [Deltaproteobacteria bacterium]
MNSPENTSLDWEKTVKHRLTQFVGEALSRVLFKRAWSSANLPPCQSEEERMRAFVRGPLAEALVPLLGRSEARRVACKIEALTCHAHGWPAPHEALETHEEERSRRGPAEH